MSEYISQAPTAKVHPVREVDIPPHTVIMTCGPSGCGKTWFVDHVLLAQLRGLPPVPGRRTVHAVHLSSDACRLELLGEDEHRHAPRMLPLSRQAFTLLNTKLQALTSFPVNAEFVVVDTKGLSTQLMARVAEVVKANGYNVMALVFQYKSTDVYRDLLPQGTPADVRRTIERDAAKVFNSTRADLRRAGIVNQVQIPSREAFMDMRFTSAGHELLRACTVPDGVEPLVIADVHGCFDELVELLAKAGITLNDHLRIVDNRFNRRVVLAGDFIDKGPQPTQVLRFIAANLRERTVIPLMGNHEHRLLRELTGEVEHVDDPRFGYTTYAQLMADEPLRRVFLEEIIPRTLPFLRSDRWVVTHAPCHVRHLGKVDHRSQRAQRYLPYDLTGHDQLVDVLEDVMGLDTPMDNVRHLCGHVMTSTFTKPFNGRQLIDAGCVAGGKLYGASIAGGRVWDFTIDAKRPRTADPLLPWLARRTVRVPAHVDPEDEAAATKLAAGGTNIVSGTMAPANKSDEALETIGNALAQFKAEGVQRVVIQPKYMGSRVNVYLTVDNASSWVTSRSGRRVDLDYVDVTPALDQLRARIAQVAPELLPGDRVAMLVVDAELLPWHVFGEQLIADIACYLESYRRETAALADTGFEPALAALLDEYTASGYATCVSKLTKAEAKERFGVKARVYAALQHLEMPVALDQRRAYADVLARQLTLFGQDGPQKLAPFAILKVVYTDGREVIPYLEPLTVNGQVMDNATVFSLVNGDAAAVTVGVDDLPAATAAFEHITGDLSMEGVVVKPLELAHDGLPYLKVRSRSYLTIVYGADYLHPPKHARLLAQRSTRAKRELSVKEWRLGLECLRTPVGSLSTPEHVHKLAALIGVGRREQALDPRL